MLTTMSITGLDQGTLKLARRQIGQFDERLLTDIGYGTPGFGADEVPVAVAKPGFAARVKSLFARLGQLATGNAVMP